MKLFCVRRPEERVRERERDRGEKELSWGKKKKKNPWYRGVPVLHY